MRYDVLALRAFGTRRVTLLTSDGMSLTGRFDQARLSDAAVVVLFAVENADGEPLVVALDAIASVHEG